MPIQTKYRLFVSSDLPNSTITDNGSSLQYELSPPINIPIKSKSTVRILDVSVWYVFPNIGQDLGLNDSGNDKFYFSVGAGVITYTLPKGLYSISNIQQTLNDRWENDGYGKNLVVMEGDDATSYISFKFSLSNITIYGDNLMYPGNISQILGYSGQTLHSTNPNEVIESNNKAQINAVSQIYLNTDISTSSYLGGKSGSNTVLSVPIEAGAAPGTQLLYQPYHLLENEIIVKTISSIRWWFLDQRGRIMDFDNEAFTLTAEIVVYE